MARRAEIKRQSRRPNQGPNDAQRQGMPTAPQHAATIDADRDRLLELIGLAASHDADVGRGLRVLALRFDYRSLLGLLQTGGNE